MQALIENRYQNILLLICFIVIIYAYIMEKTSIAVASFSVFILLSFISLNTFTNFKNQTLSIKLLSIAFVLSAIGPFLLFDMFLPANTALFYLPALLLIIIYGKQAYTAGRYPTLKAYVESVKAHKKLIFVVTFFIFLPSAFLAESTQVLILHMGSLCVYLSVVLIENKDSKT
ncbi:hypothetical protein [Pseudoalteromonas ulvae]|uniref:Uncharacterized protein n=1 Tax=Pseudoalteromonas ulvae TaxID=107327 RepID=A0A244CLF1_PSEDV|nr:hypothetical protein [Pseudoalteromonas ulvae]OUL56447.1 hypothetical protein B1199_17430 [Pseudoalteromonas ulvae]